MSPTNNREGPQENAFSQLEAEGFQIRAASLDDLPLAVKMFNSAERELHGHDVFTLERYEQEWRIPGFSLEHDTRVVLTPEAKPVGLVEVWTVLDPPVHPWIWARVDPAFQNLGIGSSLMVWGIARARHAENRVESGVRISARAGTVTGHQPSTTLFENLGMTPIRYGWNMLLEMDQAPPPTEWPEGISVHPYRHPEDAEAVFRAQDEAFQDHWGYVPGDFEQEFEQWKHALFQIHPFDPQLWFIAKEGDQIAGLSLCLPYSDEDPEKGWVEILAVRRPWRRQGLGLALLHHSFNAFYRRGLRKVGLGVDSKNLTGALRLYEKAGMQVQREQVTYELELRPGIELAKLD